jgi:hypothetical protein
MSKSKAAHAAMPRAAKPEAEKPRPFPLVILFWETILKQPEYPLLSLSLLRTTWTLSKSPLVTFFPVNHN